MTSKLTVALSTVLFLSIISTGVWACPFCSAVSKTFSEEIESMDVVVVASLMEAAPVPAADSSSGDGELAKSKFRIDEVLKGQQWAKKSDIVEVLYFGDARKDRRYLMMGTDPPNLMWSTPLGLSQRAYDYITELPKLPNDWTRLEFFQEHLEDEDEMLARDAYDEFAKAPYKDVIGLKDKMHHDRLIAWIQDPNIPASRRRLYFTMLGVCGKPDDAPMMEQMMKSSDRKTKAGLDAMIACYLILKGRDGLKIVEDLFLKNAKSEYADTYAAIMAIRFHGSETDVIPKSRLVQSLRFMLDRPELADLVIPDLARWKDWEVMPKLVQLFKDADEKSSWVRVPVVNFLRACPQPEAKEYIKQLTEIDAEAVKRAHTFFPFDAEGDGGKATEKKPEEAAYLEPVDAPQPQPIPESDQPEQVAFDAIGDVERAEPTDTTDATVALVSSSREAVANESMSRVDADSSNDIALGTETSPRRLPVKPPWQPNLLQILGVPFLAGLILLGVFRAIFALSII